MMPTVIEAALYITLGALLPQGGTYLIIGVVIIAICRNAHRDGRAAAA